MTVTIEEAKRLAKIFDGYGDFIGFSRLVWDMKAVFPQFEWNLIWGKPGDEVTISVKEK